jgi:hypothetical protein
MKSSHQIVREVIIASLLAFFVLIPSGVLMLAQAPSPGFPDLVGALESTPGCLGVEVASTPGGKRVIFAWFENKQAVLNWYYSDAHQNTMRMFFPGLPPRKPLNDIADESGPIMAIASLTVADTPQGGATSLPVSKIAIELYAPLPGGLALGGRFAPATVKVAGMMQAKMRRVQTEAVPQRDTRTVTIKVSGARNAKGQRGAVSGCSGIPRGRLESRPCTTDRHRPGDDECPCRVPRRFTRDLRNIGPPRREYERQARQESPGNANGGLRDVEQSEGEAARAEV